MFQWFLYIKQIEVKKVIYLEGSIKEKREALVSVSERGKRKKEGGQNLK